MKDWIIVGDQILSDDRLTINRNICMNENNKIFPYSYLSFKPGVMIIPVLADGRLVLIDQYRHAVKRRLIEFCAGAKEDNESGMAAAVREMAEETGYTAESIELLCGFHTLPGICNEYLEVFIATGLTAGQSSCEYAEDINVIAMTPDQVMEAISNDQITCAITISAFYKYILRNKRGEKP